jgi:hypothetical protein
VYINALVNEVYKPHDEPGLWQRVKELF